MRFNMNRVYIYLLMTLACGVLVSSAATAQDVSSDLLGRINALRSSLGTHNYTLNSALTAAAQNHAEWMASTGSISHTQPDGSTPSSRAASYGYPSRAVSENIYMGTNATADTAWGWWLNSPIHYRGITNAAYTEIGIAAANGTNGRAFVLVFGNPNGWGALPGSAAANNNNSNANSGNGGEAGRSVAAPPPSFVVGVDGLGNIMHEIQPGHTLGEIAFMYGYGWDDLEAIRQLNEMTEPEGRSLEVGSVLLIPPYEGTFTPTPGDPPTATPVTPTAIIPTDIPPPTANVIIIQSDALELQNSPTPAPPSNDDMGLLASPEPTASPTPQPVSTETPLPSPLPPTLADAPSWVAITVTPGPTVVAMANDLALDSAVAPSPREVTIAEDDSTSTVLIAIIIMQGFIIAGAGFAYWRWGRNS